MPIPVPHKTESEKIFLARCMGDSVMVAEYKENVRAGICYSQWRKAKGIKEAALPQVVAGSSKQVQCRNIEILMAAGYSEEIAIEIALKLAGG